MSDEHENVLPAAVRKQVEQADAIIAQMKAEQSGEDPTPAPEETSATEPATEAPPVTESPTETAPQPDPEPAKKAATETPPPADDALQHKYSVLKGKYDKEVPRLHRQLRNASEENASLRQQVTNLETTIAAMQAREPEPQPAPALSQEEVDQFGPDLIDIIRRVAVQETGVVLDKRLKPVEQGVEQVRGEVAHQQQNVAKSAREQMVQDLAEAVPNWASQNEDPAFLSWLGETDPYSGQLREALLADAYRSNDAPRLIALFQGFQQENVVVTDQREPAPSTEETPPPEATTGGLEELVAPGTPKTGTTDARDEGGKMIWTQRDIQQFTAEKNEFVKKYPERDLPDRLNQLERDLFAAQTEGRIKL